MLAANPSSPNTDALYLSNGSSGFTLSTADDLSIAIDYSFTSFVSSVDGGALGLVFGVGRDLDGTDSAAARVVSKSMLRSLLPADLGLLLHGRRLVLDFSDRPFDAIEFGRMLALADQLVTRMPAPAR